MSSARAWQVGEPQEPQSSPGSFLRRNFLNALHFGQGLLQVGIDAQGIHGLDFRVEPQHMPGLGQIPVGHRLRQGNV